MAAARSPPWSEPAKSKAFRPAEIIALTREGLAEPIERQMLAEFRLQNGGEQLRPSPATYDRMKGRGRLGDGLTTAAGEFLPPGLDYFPLPGNELQRFGRILTKFHEHAIAASAGAW